MFVLGTLSTMAERLPEKGVPQLENFTPSYYQNKGKIWDIRSSPNGIVYMAADKGLLEYDGKNWNSYRGPNGFTRSLLVVNDSLIYTGSDLDFGVWRKNEYQAFEYSSLYPFQNDIHLINEEFWDVHRLNEDIVFVSSQNIYIYTSQQLTRIPAPFRFSSSFSINDTLYFSDERKGLYAFNGLSLDQVFAYPEKDTFQITGIYRDKQEIVVVTRDSGLYRYAASQLIAIENELSQQLREAKVFSFERINQNYLAFGTVMRGVFIADLQGNIIHHINKHKGLPNNTILSMHYSPSGKLWLGMDYGLSALDLQNKLTYFYDFRGDFGTAHAALLIDDTFYLGTNQGLYMAGWEDLNNDEAFTRFTLIGGTDGQVWTLKHLNNTLLIGHDQGLFVLRGNSIQELSSEQGVWTIVPYRDYLLTGNYNGISIFEKTGNSWSFLKKMELILGSCNQLIIEGEHILWVNIPNFGIIRAELDHSLYPADRLIFPESTFKGKDLQLIKLEDGIHVLTDTLQYTYQKEERTFSLTSEIIPYPEVADLLPGVYQAAPLHPEYNFFPIYNGFALKYLGYNEEDNLANNTLVLRKMEAFNNETKILFHQGAIVPHRMNNLRIDFLVPHQANALYQYQLNGEGEWSSWSPVHSLEFFNLHFGEYHLLIRAKIEGEITAPLAVSFRIASPWYQRWYAYVLYALLLLIIIYLILVWQKITLKKQKKAMLIKEQKSLRKQAEKHRNKIMLLEQQRLKVEHEQLKQQLKNKTIELANKAKDNEDKNRLLMSLKDKCDAAQANPSLARMKWGEIQRLLDTYLNVDDNTFEIQMDELHQEFFKKLRDRFPALSIHDLRLCAYLKIGLNSKEIAEILNILPSSAFISRSRLRKKLNLKAEEDLHDFLNAI